MKREIYCQKLLFSATLSQNPEKLQELKLYHPQLFTSVGEEIPARPPSQGSGKCKAQGSKCTVAILANATEKLALATNRTQK
jgi:hypothetical protein